MDAAANVVSTFTTELVLPAIKAVCSILKVRSTVTSLNKELHQLRLTKFEINLKISDAIYNDEQMVTERAQKWVSDVGELESSAAEIETYYNERTTCLGGCLLNCWSDYKISRRASRTTEEAKELNRRATDLEVTRRTVPAIQRCPTMLNAPEMEPNIRKVINYLMNDAISMVGIWGMGGVGKTFLLRKIQCNPDIAKLQFDYVIWLVASQEADLGRLQEDIAVRLHLTLPVGDIVSRARLIRAFLYNKSFLLLLDDLWNPLDLEKLGVPCSSHGASSVLASSSCLPSPPQHRPSHGASSHGASSSGLPSSSQYRPSHSASSSGLACPPQYGSSHGASSSSGLPFPGYRPRHKLVFTTRFYNVCTEMQACCKIRLNCLVHETAWLFFQKSVGNAQIINSSERLHKLAMDVATRCGGLPLALRVIGRAMSAKETWREWEDAILMMDNLQLPHMWRKDEDPFPLLKISYDYLQDDRTRDCFLSISLWPENYNIPRDNLILFWMGIGLLDGFDGFTEAYNKGHAIIEDLKKACLLEEVNCILSGVYVNMHNVIRGLALWIASECGIKEKKWMVCTDMRLNEAILEDGSERWSAAERISVMNTHIHTLPQQPYCPNLSILMLPNNPYLVIPENFYHNMPCLTYLDLSHTYIRHLSASFISLVHLRYIDFSWTFLNSLPESLSNLQGLEYLLLRDTNKLSIIPKGLISSLLKLKMLDLYNSMYMKQEGTVDALVKEMVLVGGPKTLGATVTTVLDLKKLFISSSINIWRMSIEGLQGETFLHLPQTLLQTRKVNRSLQHLKLKDCPSLMELSMDASEGDSDQCCENLEVLIFIGLTNLKVVTCGVHSPRMLFENLRCLTIHNCQRLKDITWIAQLQYLEYLELTYCEGMKQVICEGQGTNIANSALSKLKWLEMINLQNLEVFCNNYLDFLALEHLHLVCPKLQMLPFSSRVTENKFDVIQITGDVNWWNELVCEKDNIKQFFEPYFKMIDINN